MLADASLECDEADEEADEEGGTHIVHGGRPLVDLSVVLRPSRHPVALAERCG